MLKMFRKWTKKVKISTNDFALQIDDEVSYIIYNRCLTNYTAKKTHHNPLQHQREKSFIYFLNASKCHFHTVKKYVLYLLVYVSSQPFSNLCLCPGWGMSPVKISNRPMLFMYCFYGNSNMLWAFPWILKGNFH